MEYQNQKTNQKKMITRRQFIKSTTASAAAFWLSPSISWATGGGANPLSKSTVAMVTHPGLINNDESINSRIARLTVDRALLSLTDQTDIKNAWVNLFPNLKPDDTIGIKVNAVNNKCPTRTEVVYAMCDSLIESLEFNPNNLIIWDRSDAELKRTKYELNTSGEGIRCFGTVRKFSVVKFFLKQKQSESGSIGYDAGQVIDVGNAKTTLLSKIITKKCTYLINVPVLKDHGIAGVTLSLKNHYGSIDNPHDLHGDFCDPYTAMINAAPQIKDKTKLILCDAIYGIYDGGPLGAPQWRNRQILASTDPVALDTVGMQIINKKRHQKGVEPVTSMATHLKTAQKLGLGTCEPNSINIKDTKLT